MIINGVFNIAIEIKSDLSNTSLCCCRDVFKRHTEISDDRKAPRPSVSFESGVFF